MVLSSSAVSFVILASLWAGGNSSIVLAGVLAGGTSSIVLAGLLAGGRVARRAAALIAATASRNSFMEMVPNDEPMWIGRNRNPKAKTMPVVIRDG